jgi:hypothetical protein
MRRRLELALVALLLVAAPPAGAAAEAVYRFSAPITVTQPGPFVQLPLPASAYARSQQAGLNDLRIVDARGQRVPFALLAPRASKTQDVERTRAAVLFPLPNKPAAGQDWPLPVDVVVQGDRISVSRAAARPSPAGAPGWLIDLGEPRPGEPPPRALQLEWSTAEFSAAFDLALSDDLRNWRAGGSGQVMSLASASGTLTQPRVLLPAPAARFVRLVWLDPATAPALTGAQVVAALANRVALDPPTALQFSPGADSGRTDDASAGALHFDLGGILPLSQLQLQLAPGTRVAPVRMQARNQPSEPWRELAQAVFYRLERGGAVSESPPLDLFASLRYLRVVPDVRSAGLDPAQTRLLVQAQLASLVFALQGEPPFELRAGAADAPASALPATTLVPALDDERPRFGRATLGEWLEVAEVARQAEAAQRRAAWRPWLLWAVLLLGVAGLAWMVIKLTRQPGAR